MHNNKVQQIQNQLSKWLTELCHHDPFCEDKLRALIKNQKPLLNKINREFKYILENPDDYLKYYKEIQKSIYEFMANNLFKISKCIYCSAFNLINPISVDNGKCHQCNNKFKTDKPLTTILQQKNEDTIIRKCLYCSNKVFANESLVCAHCFKF